MRNTSGGTPGSRRRLWSKSSAVALIHPNSFQLSSLPNAPQSLLQLPARSQPTNADCRPHKRSQRNPPEGRQQHTWDRVSAMRIFASRRSTNAVIADSRTRLFRMIHLLWARYSTKSDTTPVLIEIDVG